MTRPIILLMAAAAVLPAQVRISDPVDGAILNHLYGEAVKNGLRVRVTGEAPAGQAVRVNGKPATAKDGRFEAFVVLTAPETRITAEAAGARDAITVLWDRHNYPRYRVSTDDNIWFLRDIARKNYPSIFDNPYLAMWRELHRKYGAKIHHNIYYETDGFNLSRMPDRYKKEWQQNRDWLRLTFHARANDPDRPYIKAPAEQVIRDYKQVTAEIERFAGKELLSDATTIHWGEATRDACLALRKEGFRMLAGYFQLDPKGAPRVSYYLNADQTRYLDANDYWKDTRTDLIFIRHDIVINTVPLEKITAYLDKVASNPKQAQIMELMIHEQYFYPDYRVYEPDFRLRVERALEWVVKRNYKPVFYGEEFRAFTGAR